MTYQGVGPYYPNGVAGDGTNNRYLDPAIPGVDNSTRTPSVGTSGGGDYFMKPFTTGFKGAYTTTGQDFGWNMKAANTNAPDGISKRRVPAGTWSCTGGIGITSGTGYPSSATTVRVNVYARAVSTGALRYLGTLSGAVTPVALSTSTWTATASLPEVILAVGETIDFELYYTVPNALLTNYTLSFVTGSTSALTLPGTGLGTVYARAQTDSAPASDVSPVPRTARFPRTTAESLPTTSALARALFMARELAETIASVPVLGRVYAAARELIENIGPADGVAVRQVLFRRMDAESYATTDTMAVSFVGHRTIAESLSTLVDSLSRGFVGGRGLTETVTTSASLDRMVRFNRGAPETTSTTDQLDRQLSLLRGGTEDVPTSESLFRQLTYVRQVVDDLALGGTSKKVLTIIIDD